jgi:NADH-ubiquinone oxidoreductase chain 2
MILTAALDNGFIFITFIAIFTSVISAVYYLFIIKTIFSEEKVYKLVNNTSLHSISLSSSITLPIAIITIFLTIYILDNDILTLTQLYN